MAELIAAGAATVVGAVGAWLLTRERDDRRRALVPLPVRPRRRRGR